MRRQEDHNRGIAGSKRSSHFRFCETRCHAVRFLHAGLCDGHKSLLRQEPGRDARSGSQRAGREHLPLRHVCRRHGLCDGTGEERRQITMATELKVAWGPRKENVYLGKSMLRMDGVEKASGAAKYTADTNPKDCLVAKLLTFKG